MLEIDSKDPVDHPKTNFDSWAKILPKTGCVTYGKKLFYLKVH